MPKALEDFWANLHFLEPEKLALLWGVLVFFFLCLGLWGWFWAFRPSFTWGSRYPLMGRMKFWFLLVLALALLVGAWSQPFLEESAISIERGSVEVVFLIDNSSSMFLRGLGVSRLEVAVREIGKLLSAGVFKDNDRLGLFLFGKSSLLRVHLSRDLERFANELGKIGPPQTLKNNEFFWGSDIAMTLEHLYQSLDAQDRFFETRGSSGQDSGNWKFRVRADRLVILFTDGDFEEEEKEVKADNQISDRQKLDNALQEMRRRGLKIFAVGVGTRSPEPLVNILKGYKVDEEYEASLSEELKDYSSGVVERHIKHLAQATRGEVLVIDRLSASAFDFLKAAINMPRSLSIERKMEHRRQELWVFLLLLAVAVLSIAIIIH